MPVRFAVDGGGRACGENGARDAEVGEHGVPLLEENVLRLDVAMHDSLAMRERQRIRDLDENAHCILHGELAALLEPVAQRLAAHVRHHVPEQIVVRPRREYRHDVRMLQLRGDLDLLLEARGAHLARELWRQHLDDDLAIERPLHGHEQPAHPSAAQLALEQICVAERCLKPCRKEQIVHEGTSDESTHKIVDMVMAP